MKHCTKCKKDMLGYSDSVHDVWLCWRCGKFDGSTRTDDDFTEMITKNPMMILYLIDAQALKPIPN